MRKLLPLIALLFISTATAFSNPRPFTLISREKVTDLTAVTSEGSIFQLEDNGNDGVDKVTEWFSGMQFPLTYTGKEVRPSQQTFFGSATSGYLQAEGNNFLNAFRQNSKSMKYTPFGIGDNKGEAVLYTNGIEYRVNEDAGGALSFHVGTPAFRGYQSQAFLDIEKAAVGSRFYSGIKTLVDTLAAERGAIADSSYAELGAVFSLDTSSK
jgi:hypothetical protein